MSAAEKGASLHHPHRRTETTSAPQLRLITGTDSPVRSETESTRARVKPALAVWRLERSRSTRPLPSELARQLIEHYTEPGDLVLASQGASDALRQARRLGRRALPLNTCRRNARGPSESADVIALRPDEPAELAIVVVTPRVSERRAADLAAQLSERLKPGAFLVLAPDDVGGRLGAIVRACQQQGLQYWQHVVALHPDELEPKPVAAEGTGRRSLRCHRDLLIFRRPAATDALASKAAAVAEVAA